MKVCRHGVPGVCSGFTLLELLVSTAVIGIVMLVLLSATSAGLGLWRGAEQRIFVDREARNGMALIADDLANMLPTAFGSPLNPVFSKEGSDFFMAFPVVRPAVYQESDAANVGDLCYVYYRYINSEKRIYRSSVDSKATFEALQGGSPPVASLYDVVADNVTFLEYNTYDAQGRESLDAHSLSLGIGVIDKQERENLERNPPIPMPAGRTTERYFSIYAVVPRIP